MFRDSVPDLVHRVWSEFREFPGEKLTYAQARRLFGMGEQSLQRILAALWMTHHVNIDGDRVLRGDALPDGGQRGATRGRILIVEDDDAQRQGIVAGLRAAGFTVEAAGDAGHGMAMALLKPDVIILDIGLPDSDGHSIARCVRAEAETRNIPIVYMTARQGADDVARAREFGAAAYLVKPCRTQAVVQVIERVLNERGRTAAEAHHHR